MRLIQPRYRFVAGKGGVGKTTCAAALAVVSARSGRRTLLISTDPAPSVGDALRQTLGAVPKAIRGVRGLDAVEIDAAAALESWLAPRRTSLERIALRGTWLDADDVARLLRLSLPGIDEIAALLQIVDLGEQERYAHVVVDTAPTGHLLRMIGMPDLLQRLAEVFDAMQAKHRAMVRAFSGRWSPDPSDALIEEIGLQARLVAALLRDADRTALSWVTLPEPMAIEESADGLESLRRQGVRVDRVIVNRLTQPPPQPCRWCAARRNLEARAVRDLRQRPAARGIPMVPLPATDAEPRGAAALQQLGNQIGLPPRLPSPAPRRLSGRTSARLPVSGAAIGSSVVPPGTRLVLFGGKGGVGKTTCAAAVALEIAASAPQTRVLLLSADPAHSLGDVFGQTCSDAAGPVRGGPPNLLVRELDAEHAYGAVRDRVTAGIEALFGRLTADSAVDVTYDRHAMHALLDLAPPGIDELAAVVEVTEDLLRLGSAEKTAEYGLIVMDTAPTGHALRLLEMPSLVHDWVRTVMSIVLKYQSAVRLGDFGTVLLRLSQGLGRLRELLRDPARARFVAVTRPGALPRAETIRLLERLAAARLSTPLLIVNGAGAGTCRRCVTERERQAREITTLRRALVRTPGGPGRVLVTAGESPAPNGAAALLEWRGTWRELD